MPQYDQTGPMGLGSQTGRKQGRCFTQPETSDETTKGGQFKGCGRRQRTMENEEHSFQGRRGHGRGRGRGFGRKDNALA